VPSNPLPRVLCVEDDEDSRVVLIRLLRHALIEAKAVVQRARGSGRSMPNAGGIRN
jgi:CheY-like chemotaxis protein